MARKTNTINTFDSNGNPVTVTVMDGLYVEDLVIQGMKASAYQTITGKPSSFSVSRDIKDYLIKLGIVTE